MNKLDYAVLSLRTDSKVAQVNSRSSAIFSGYLIGVRYFAQKGLILPSS